MHFLRRRRRRKYQNNVHFVSYILFSLFLNSFKDVSLAVPIMILAINIMQFWSEMIHFISGKGNGQTQPLQHKLSNKARVTECIDFVPILFPQFPIFPIQYTSYMYFNLKFKKGMNKAKQNAHCFTTTETKSYMNNSTTKFITTWQKFKKLYLWALRFEQAKLMWSVICAW